MSLRKDINKCNHIINDRLMKYRLKEFMTDSRYSDYCLFDFFNILKIRRLEELKCISEEDANELFQTYRKYMNKLAEMNSPLMRGLKDEIVKEYARCRELLREYDIDIDIENNMFNIKNVAAVDLSCDTVDERHFGDSHLLSLNEQRVINKIILPAVYDMKTIDLSYPKIYNLAKIRLMQEKKYLYVENIDSIEDMIRKRFDEDDHSNDSELENVFLVRLGKIQYNIIDIIDFSIAKKYERKALGTQMVKK